MGGKRFLVSSSRAQPRDLFRLPFAVFLRKSICMKHRDPQSHEAYGVSRSPLPSQLLPDRERKRFLTFARNDNMGKAAFSYRKPSPLGKGDRAAVDRVLSQTAYLRRSLPSLFHTARTLSGSLRSPPSPRGEGFVRRYSFSTYAYIRSDNARKAAFSYRSLVFSSLRAKRYPHRLSISPRNPRA